MNRLLRSLGAALVLSFALPACSGVETGDEQDVAAANARFELFTGADSQHYFQLIAKNGERLLSSEGYTSTTGAKNGVTSVKNNGTTKSRFHVIANEAGEYYFNLVAGNGQIIGTSETYASKSNADKGVTAVMNALSGATNVNASSGERFETFTGADAKSYFRLRAQNGEIILDSQGYSSKSSAQNGIASVKTNGADASKFDIVSGANGQFTFRLVAGNGHTIGHGEMYASKSGAIQGAATVRDVVRELSGAGNATDAEITTELETAAEGYLFTSESDYPFTVVSASVDPSASITVDLVKSALGFATDADPGADKPIASAYSMSQTWEDWKNAGHQCDDPDDPGSVASCHQLRNIEQVVESNLTDIHVYYFGNHGSAGNVQGIGVSIYIVGRTPAGTLMAIRTLAIWT